MFLTPDCSRHSGRGKERSFPSLQLPELGMPTRLTVGLKIPGHHPNPPRSLIRRGGINNPLPHPHQYQLSEKVTNGFTLECLNSETFKRPRKMQWQWAEQSTL